MEAESPGPRTCRPAALGLCVLHASLADSYAGERQTSLPERITGLDNLNSSRLWKDRPCERDCPTPLPKGKMGKMPGGGVCGIFPRNNSDGTRAAPGGGGRSCAQGKGLDGGSTLGCPAGSGVVAGRAFPLGVDERTAAGNMRHARRKRRQMSRCRQLQERTHESAAA